MKLSKLLTTITLLAVAAAPVAMKADGVGVAIVKSDGSVHNVELLHIDRIAIGPDAVTLHHRVGESVSHDIADIERIDIGVNVVTAGIDEITAAGDIAVWPTLVETALNVKGAPAEARISVYTLAGVLAATAAADAAGAATLDLSALAPGAYIVAIDGNHSVKIVKK